MSIVEMVNSDNRLYRISASVSVVGLIGVSVWVWSSQNELGPRNSVKSPSPEMVMEVGAAISVQSQGDTLKIISSAEFERILIWRDCRLAAPLHPRSSRWFGSLGAYNAGASFGLPTLSCEGISRPVVQEGQIHFDDESFANEWIRRRPESYKTVRSANGLLISWAINPSRQQIGIDIWLICLNGRPFNSSVKSEVNSLAIAAGVDGRTLHNCAEVKPEAISQTRDQLEKDWQQYRDRRWPPYVPRTQNDASEAAPSKRP